MRVKVLLLLLSVGLLSCSQPRYLTKENVVKEKLSGMSACAVAFEKSKRCVSVTWEDGPRLSEFSSFVFKIERPNRWDGSAVPEDLEVLPEVEPWMPAAGMDHGTSPVTVEKIDVGTYRATLVFFSMQGRWDIHFKYQLGTEVDHAKISVDL